MMMPSTMILTICISMVLKRNRGNRGAVYHWTLGLARREQNTKLITLIANFKSWIQSLPQTDAEAAQVISKLWCDLVCTLCWSCWIGTGGSKLRLPRQKFSVTSVGVIFNHWGLNPHAPPRQIERWSACVHMGSWRQDDGTSGVAHRP